MDTNSLEVTIIEAGKVKQCDRPSPTYFLSSDSAKDTFSNDQSGFFRKFSAISIIFPNLKLF